MMNHRDRRSRRGFTAIELLVAAGIGAVLLTIVGLAFNQVTTSVGLARARAECYQTFRAVSALIEKDLDGLAIDRTASSNSFRVFPSSPHNMMDINGNAIYPPGDPTSWELYSDVLRIQTASPFNPNGTGKVSLIRYGLVEIDPVTWVSEEGAGMGGVTGGDPGNPADRYIQQGYTLEMRRQVFPMPRPHDATDYHTDPDNQPVETLAPYVVGFRVDYWNEAAGQWAHGTSAPPQGLRLIRIRMDIVDSMGQILRNDGAPMTFILEKDLDRPIGSGDGL